MVNYIMGADDGLTYNGSLDHFSELLRKTAANSHCEVIVFQSLLVYFCLL